MIFITFLPLFIMVIGVLIGLIAFLIAENFFDLETETISLILAIISSCTLVGCIIATEYRSNYYLEKIDNYYTETENLIQSRYVVYVNGIIVDSDKIFIRDYFVDNIHRNDELKEIYISTD